MAGFRNRLRDLFRREGETPSGEPIVVPARSAGTASVSVNDALGLSTVNRAVSVHAVAAKQLR